MKTFILLSIINFACYGQHKIKRYNDVYKEELQNYADTCTQCKQVRIKIYKQVKN